MSNTKNELNESNKVFDVVIPNNNEEIFIETALALGYKEIVFLTNNINYNINKFNNKKNNIASSKIKIKIAYLIKNSSDISNARRRFDLIFATADRKYFESKVDFIIYAEDSERKDSFHYRSTSLNQVHAQLSKNNNIIIGINFGALLSDAKTVRIILGKMIQNAMLIKKYKLKYATFSLAKTPELMRSKEILHSLEKVIKL